MSGLGQSGPTDPDDFNRGDGDPDVGRELTAFFLELLADGEALKRYYDRDTRDGLIDDRQWSTNAGDLLRNGSLKEIEEHILAIRGSYAKPLVIVWPAM